MSRVWEAVIPEQPEGVKRIMDRDRDLWELAYVSQVWRLEGSTGCAVGLTWDELVKEYGPLTEVPM